MGKERLNVPPTEKAAEKIASTARVNRVPVQKNVVNTQVARGLVSALAVDKSRRRSRVRVPSLSLAVQRAGSSLAEQSVYTRCVWGSIPWWRIDVK